MFIGTPENFDARSKTFTKKHNTINIWVVITVAGRVPDKILTQELEPRYVVLADRGCSSNKTGSHVLVAVEVHLPCLRVWSLQ